MKAAKDFGQLVEIFDRIWQKISKYKDDIIVFTSEIYRIMKLRLYGKSISVIGPVAAGKTTLLNILNNPDVAIDPMNYEKTTDPNIFAEKIIIEWKLPIDDNEYKKETIKLKIRKPKDVGGEMSIRDSEDGWKDVCINSDFLFYLFDASKFGNDDTTEIRISEDFKWIAEHAQSYAPGFQIVIFANKMDKIDIDKREKWIEQEIPKIEKISKKSLGPYLNHLALITPCSLLSNITRTNSISLALKCLAEISPPNKND